MEEVKKEKKENIVLKKIDRRLETMKYNHAAKKFEKHRSLGEKIVYGIMFVVFTIFALSFIIPFLWILMNSFKTTKDYTNNFNGFPKEWTLDNFVKAFTFKDRSTNNYTILQMLGMSILVAGGGTLATIFFSSCAAYVVAKYRFPGRSIIFGVVIFSLIVPIVGALPSQIQLMKALHLDGKIIGCIFIYSGGFGMNFMLLYSFFKNLSWTYVEAAKIDGAGDFKIFFRIIMPLAKGPIVAVTVMQLIGLWNDYLTPSIFLPEKPTLAYGLRALTEKMYQNSNYTLLFATIIVTMLPIIILFCCFSKTIMENTSIGGLKG